MNPLDLAGLTALMERTGGRREVVVGLVDGPIAMNHPDLTRDTIREVPGKMSGTCAKTNSAACLHGTFVAGILCAKRGTAAPAICPSCTLLAYPISPRQRPAIPRCQAPPPRTSRRQSSRASRRERAFSI
jgi:hypothetical protein